MTMLGVSRGTIRLVGRDESFASEVDHIVSHEFDDQLHVVAHGSLTEYLDECVDDEHACVLLDLDPSLDATTAMAALTLARADTPAILVTENSDVDASVSALKAGAVDYLVKPAEARRLSRALRRAIELDAQRRMERARAADSRSLYAALNSTERRIVRLIVEGRVNKQIAAELYCCERTAKARRAQVMKKLGCRSVAEVVRIWRRLLPFAGVDDVLKIRARPALPLFALSAATGKRQYLRYQRG